MRDQIVTGQTKSFPCCYLGAFPGSEVNEIVDKLEFVGSDGPDKYFIKIVGKGRIVGTSTARILSTLEDSGAPVSQLYF